MIRLSNPPACRRCRRPVDRVLNVRGMCLMPPTWAPYCAECAWRGGELDAEEALEFRRQWALLDGWRQDRGDAPQTYTSGGGA